MATASELVAMAMTQVGKPYVLGAEADPADPSPSAFDCSELVEWACARVGLDPRMPDYSCTQYLHCRNAGLGCSVEEAASTFGALLFTNRNAAGEVVEPDQGQPTTAHVAISLGDGRTVEAMGTKWGVLVGSMQNRSFSQGARIPGLVYDVAAAPRARAGAGVAPAAEPVPAADGTDRRWLELGETGPDVAELQALLLRIGAQALPTMRPTGTFGDLTDVAVRLFQCHVQAHYDPTMEVDGKCGPVTWGWIQKLAPEPPAGG